MRKTCLDTVYELSLEDEKVLFIGSDLWPGVLDDFKKKMPKRFLLIHMQADAMIYHALFANQNQRNRNPSNLTIVIVYKISYSELF